MKITYTKSTLSKIEQIFKESDYKVRYEKGQFKSGYCVLHQKKIIVVNKFFDLKGRIESLLDIVHEVSLPFENLSEAGKVIYNKILGSPESPQKMVA